MTLSQLIADHGYLAVFLGSILEGETILILAGFATQQHYLSFPLVVALAIAGGSGADSAYFYLGRRHGRDLLKRHPQWAPRVLRVNHWLVRYQARIVIGVRFMYGLRIVGPIAIGMSDIPAWRFLVFNLIGAVIWAPLFVGAGFLFGNTLEWLFTDIKHYEEAAFLIIIAAALGLALVRHLRRRG